MSKRFNVLIKVGGVFTKDTYYWWNGRGRLMAVALLIPPNNQLRCLTMPILKSSTMLIVMIYKSVGTIIRTCTELKQDLSD